MTRKFSAMTGLAATAWALWTAGHAGAQEPSPSYAAHYNEGAYLASPSDITQVTAEDSGFGPAPQAPSGLVGPGGMMGPAPTGPSPLAVPGPGMMGAPEGAVPPGMAAPAPAPAPAPAAAPALAAGLGGAVGGGGAGVPNMIGDQGPFFAIQQVTPPGIPPGRPPGLPNPGARSLLAPSVRGFKIAENQSPIPQDRFFYNFNYFEDVNARLNEAFDTPITDLKVYRHVFGVEKTIFDGNSSLGVRLPLNTLYAADRDPPVRTGGNSTSLGDLTVFGKMVVRQDPMTGSLLTVGLAITPPTGPSRFAGAGFIGGTNPIHNTTIQPFLGYYLNFGDLFFHGFSALDVPVDPRDVTILYNDLGVGYYLLRSTHRDAILTAVVPTIEAHVNTPLNHRNEYDQFDPTGTPDILNITSGINFEFYRSSVLTFGFVTPLTGPRPFDFETVLLFNLRFGGARTTRPPFAPLSGG